MKRTKGIGPFLVISDEIAATSSGCPVVTSDSSYPIDNTRKVTATAEGIPHPSLLKGKQRAKRGVD
jgi:hypothetical protein